MVWPQSWCEDKMNYHIRNHDMIELKCTTDRYELTKIIFYTTTVILMSLFHIIINTTSYGIYSFFQCPGIRIVVT